MDLAPLIVIVFFVGIIALSIWSRTQNESAGSPRTELKPPGEPGDKDRPDGGIIYP
jgi:hypothetical protein